MVTTGTRLSLTARLRELVSYRYLIQNLVARNLKVRYKNSLLGVAWSMLNPLLMMLVFTVVFTILAGGMDVAVPPAFILAGLLPWTFFSGTITAATRSLVDSSHLIKKVYFPREVLPLSIMLSNLVHFLIALPIYFILALVLGIPGAENGTYWPYLAWLPVIIVVEAIFALGLSLLTATINVFYRDMEIVMDTLILAWFFVTPVFYDFTKTFSATHAVLGTEIPVSRIAFILNPMASIIAAYRDAIYYGRMIGLDFLLRTALTSVIILVIGYWFFQRQSWRFGEEL
jgi:ABC-type polysaccharide/polyol phosphate export permease